MRKWAEVWLSVTRYLVYDERPRRCAAGACQGTERDFSPSKPTLKEKFP